MERLMIDHFRGKIRPHDIPSWKSNPLWYNSIQRCPIPINMTCDVCCYLAFNVVLRGPPIASHKWFNDTFADMSIQYYKDLFPEIEEEAFKFILLDSERELRLVTRTDVYYTIMLFFRGYTTDYLKFLKQKPKNVLGIIRRKCGKITKWVDFKVLWDKKLSELYAKAKDETFYCTGCGIKCETDWSRKDYSVKYQKCAQSKCPFFHSSRSIWAKVKIEE